jgi:hypothetical protein
MLRRVNIWRDRMQGIGPHLVALENKWIVYWSIDSASLCSSHVRYVVPEGATIEIRKMDPTDLENGLCGPAHHGSVMMRRGFYQKVGGYRPSFYYAQDIDLWSRLVELGSHQLIPEVLYTASVTPGSISGSRRKEQDSFHRIIEATTAARRNNQPEDRWLRQAEALSQRCRQAPRTPHQIAAGAYYIGSCLFNQGAVLGPSISFSSAQIKSMAP